MEKFYYHASFACNLYSILVHGLIPNFHQYWNCSKKGWLYFSKYQNIAEDMVATVEEKYISKEDYETGIVIFAVPESAFDLSLMKEDDNIAEDCKDDMQCYIYPKIIPPNFLQNYLIIETV